MGRETYFNAYGLCGHLLYKISRNGAHPVPLDAVSDYKEAEAVPPEKRARLLRDLRGEVQAREIMGDEAYFGTASLISKIITYEQATMTCWRFRGRQRSAFRRGDVPGKYAARLYPGAAGADRRAEKAPAGDGGRADGRCAGGGSANSGKRGDVRMKCPECGADGRVCYVKEDAPGGVEVTYLCPNRRCRLYGQDCAVETLGC
ncbi:hypothetical protein [Ruthenibacterium lactatiformans]|uniref:hypothetical protein n=1 Tax=Ruthenibacterium lactatiformans TaxID=1550024 RepID=UPI0019670492|nr:hypothetical protein [Ruthenibacterium lactatiformans]MBN3008655.1 hypothetical protein [Ruthenibacterium lactatiformans]